MSCVAPSKHYKKSIKAQFEVLVEPTLINVIMRQSGE